MTQELLDALLRLRFQNGLGWGFTAGMLLGSLIAFTAFALNWPVCT
jgi:hypothetical protein